MTVFVGAKETDAEPVEPVVALVVVNVPEPKVTVKVRGTPLCFEPIVAVRVYGEEPATNKVDVGLEVSVILVGAAIEVIMNIGPT